MAQPSKAADRANVRRRTITAAVLAPLVLAVVYAGTLPTAALVMLAAMAMAGELADVAAGSAQRTPVPLATATAAVAVIFATTETYAAVIGVLVLGGLLMLLAMRERRGLITACGVVYTGGAAAALVALRQVPEHGWALVIWLLLTVWASDAGAYVAGRTLGRRQLLPRISPNKTWAGLGGAAVGAAGVGVIAVGVLPGVIGILPGRGIGAVLAVGAALGTIGQGGDLLESAWKRYFDRKDSGALLPGHGGILDRADALLAAALATAALVYLGGHA